MKLQETSVPLALIALLAFPLAAQQPEPVLSEGSDLPGLPGTPISSLNNPNSNAAGGWVIELNYESGGSTISAAFGSKDSVDPDAILIQEATVGDYIQSAFESWLGISDAGLVCYSPATEHVPTMTTGLDAVWLDTFPIAVEDEPILTLPGKLWRFASRPGITANGFPTWVGGVNDALSGSSEGNGVFFGITQTPILVGGQAVPGLPFPLSFANTVAFDYRFSPNGSRFIDEVQVLVASSSADNWVVVDDGTGSAAMPGAPTVLLIGGLAVGEGELMPASLQVDPAEAWDNFDYFGISDDGSYLMTGDTDGPTATDEFVVVDGELLFREGDTVDGKLLKDFVSAACMSSIEDVAFVMESNDGTTTDPEVLFFNGRVLMEEGQAVDFDGDGIVDPSAIVRDFTGINALAISSERVVYVTADVDTMGTSTTSDDTEVLFRIPVPDLAVDVSSLSLATGGTASFRLFTRRDVPVDFYFLLGSASGSTPGLPVDGLVLPLNFSDPYFAYTLENPNTAVLVDTFATPGVLGAADAQFVLPTGLNPSFAGTTLTHAFATIETTSFTVSSVSNPVDFDLVP